MRITSLCATATALVAIGAAPAPALQSPVTEEPARTAADTAARGTVHGCKYGQFCTYTGDDYTGMLDQMSSCTLHTTHGLFRSYVNNQTRGTRARFYLGDRRLITRTKPAPAKGTTSFGLTTYYIRPC